MAAAPCRRGERLTLSIGPEEEGEEQQQRPGYVHHPAAWQQRALAAWIHCLQSRSESVRSEISAGTLSEPGQGEEEKRGEENKKMLRIVTSPPHIHTHSLSVTITKRYNLCKHGKNCNYHACASGKNLACEV